MTTDRKTFNRITRTNTMDKLVDLASYAYDILEKKIADGSATRAEITLADGGKRTLASVRDRLTTARNAANRACSHCRSNQFTPMDDFMLHNTVWSEAHPEGEKGVLHLTCVEQRLGRPLTPPDFKSAFSFVNRYVLDISLEQWEQYLGRPLSPFFASLIHHQNSQPIPADALIVLERIKNA